MPPSKDTASKWPPTVGSLEPREQAQEVYEQYNTKKSSANQVAPEAQKAAAVDVEATPKPVETLAEGPNTDDAQKPARVRAKGAFS